MRWHYTPMMLPSSRHVAAQVTVYDCMDELSAFRFAPPELLTLEEELLREADLVFTGGYSPGGIRRFILSPSARMSIISRGRGRCRRSVGRRGWASTA